MLAETDPKPGRRSGNIPRQERSKDMQPTSRTSAVNPQGVSSGTEATGREGGSSMVEKAQDIASSVVDTTKEVASSVAEKAQDVASTVAHRTSDMASSIGHRAQDAASSVAHSVECGAHYVREQ